MTSHSGSCRAMQTSREGFSYPRARKENNFLFLTPTPWEDACRRKPNTKRHLSLRPRAKAPRHSVLTFGQCREHGAWQPEKSPRDEGTSLFQGSSRGGRRIPAYTLLVGTPGTLSPGLCTESSLGRAGNLHVQPGNLQLFCITLYLTRILA